MGPPSLPIVIHTDFTCVHMNDMVFCAPDLAYQNGAVVINEKDEVLVLEDLESGFSSLPRFIEEESLERLIKSPLQFVNDQTGLSVERLPLVKPIRKYQALGVKQWKDLEAELCFDSVTTATTDPFLVGMDIAWFHNHQRPENPDGRQSFINWYSGIVRGEQQVTRGLDTFRVHFLPIKDALSAVSDHDFVAEPALLLFDVLLKATKRLRPKVN